MGLLRLALAVSVLLAHMGNYVHRCHKTLFGLTFLDADLAVQCFFMLSGFYMALVLNEKYRGPNSYVLFIIQRFFRLYPTYWLVLGVVLVVELMIAATHGNRRENTFTLQFWMHNNTHLPWLTWLVLGFTNLTFFGLNDLTQVSVNLADGRLCGVGAPGSIPAPAYTLVPPAWSLGIEAMFYLVAPYLVRRSVAWQAGLFLLLAGARLGLEYGLNVPYLTFIFSFTLLQFPFFLAGSLAYRLYVNRATFPRLFAGAGLPWIFLLTFMVLLYHRLPLTKSAWMLLYPLLFLSIPALFALTKDHFWDRQIGELSYAFYLIHYFVIELANVLADQVAIPVWLVTPGCILTTLLLSIAITQLFENRVDRFRAALFQRSRARVAQGEAGMRATSLAPPAL